MLDAGPALLSIRDLEGWYGESQALHGMSLDVRSGEVVTLVGRNGAGKTTTLRAIIGALKRRRGSINFDGTETIGMASRKIARLGIGYVPEERGIFATLTVAENLFLPPIIRPGGLPTEGIYELFPNLRERLGSYGRQLSGGEQQMLAIARVLRTGSNFLLFDEPTEGLAPVIIDQIGRSIHALKQQSFTIVLVEQNVAFAARVTDRFYVVEQGRVIDAIPRSGTGETDMKKLHSYLGV